MNATPHNRRVRLIDLLRPDLIIPRLQATTKRAAMEELLDCALAGHSVDPARRGAYLDALLKREASRSTGLELGVAVPHAEVEGLPHLIGCMGLAPAGIEFDSFDGEPARIIILMLVPPNYLQAHVKTLAGIARMVNDRRLRNQLLTATEADTILSCLEQAEGRLQHH